ncbi:MAG: DUF882 domain-containing protein [Desulfobulbaceae bacterium]|nr:DUF882 domain-containing protein [Desulfobulbaceae bacterium]
MPFSGWCRRSFLKASLIATLALFSGETAWANILTDEELQPGRLNLLNTHTGEHLNVTYRDRDGRYDQQAIDAINWLLRCHHTNEVHPIDIRTVEYLNQVHQRLDGEHEIHVISAYRSPEYNALLRRQGQGVAKHSLHLEGRALDIRIPGVNLSTLHRVALNLKMGGVGYYPETGFIHLDSGSFRTW